MGITIKEIAEIAGVSRGTVDRVLNNRGSVRIEVKEKILAIIKEKNYKPNRIAKALVSSHVNKKTIGIVLNSLGNPFYDDVIKGINDKKDLSEEFGINLIFKNEQGYEVEKQLKAIDELIEKKISGLIITPINDEKIILKLKELEKNNIPVINLNVDIENTERLAYIGPDYIKTGKVAGSIFSMLARNEKFKVLIVTGSKKILGHNMRILGIKNYVENNAKNIEIVDVIENQDSDAKSYKSMNEWLNKNYDIDGVFFCAGGIKGGIDSLIENRKIENLKIITVDLTNVVRENLIKNNIVATICQEPYKQGQLSVEVLVDYLTNYKEPLNKIIYMATEIFVKESL